jgi:hypothetical protein
MLLQHNVIRMRFALALLLIAPTITAQLTSFGDPVPLTDTRYGAFGGEVKLVSAGVDAYVFWEHAGKVRMAKVIPGVNRVSRPVLDIHGSAFDVVWTGSHFVVAGAPSGNPDSFVTRAVRGDGEPVGPAQVLPDAMGDTPRLAFNGTEGMLVYRRDATTYAAILNPDGTPRGTPPQPIVYGTASDRLAIASDGTRFLVMNAGAASVRFTTVTRNGAVTGSLVVAEDFMSREREVALSASGDTFIAVWQQKEAGPLVMLEVRPGRTRRIVPETEDATSPSVLAGAGGRVDLAYFRDGAFHVQDGFGNDRVPQTPASEGSTSLASMNGHVLSAWHGRDGTILTRDLDDPASRGRQTAFGAAGQELLATASAPHAALIIWSESDGAVYAGIRAATGAWTEGKIGEPGETVIAAASDGARFAVLKKTSAGGTVLTFLDDSAGVAGQTPDLGFRGMDLTASGSTYAIAGVNAEGHLVMALASAAGGGTAQPPRIVSTRLDGHDIENVRVASNGLRYLAVWQDTRFEVCFPVCNPYVSAIRAVEVDAQLLPVDGGGPLAIAADPAIHPDVAWDGDSRYVVVWNRRGVVETRSVRSKSLTSVVRIDGTALGQNAPRAVPVPFGVGLTFATNQIVVLREGVEVERRTFDGVVANDALVSVGRRIDHLQTVIRDEMPYHGARRIFVRTAESTGPDPRPTAPHIAVHGLAPMRVHWTAARNSVNGYRVEYSVNDGAWNELDEWFDRDELSFSIEPWIPGANYRFRVRALSLWGASDYSNEAAPRTTKRRAVR